MRDFEAQLRAQVSRMESADRDLADELRRVRGRAERRTGADDRSRVPLESTGASPPDAGESERADLAPQLALETIVLRNGRPVLSIVDDGVELRFPDAESEVWRVRLTTAGPLLQRAVRAVGRIELQGHPRYAWVGTGWLVDRDVIVTNRHVAREFGQRKGAAFVFSMGSRGQMRATVDFLEEAGRLNRREFAIAGILDIADDGDPDVAFLRVEPMSGTDPLAAPIELFEGDVDVDRRVAVIGYPAGDSRVPDQALVRRIFGNVYDKKRLAPGQITGTGKVVHHDCSTLGGNSGSVVLDLDSGRAIALHFAGRFLEANYAVAATVVGERLAAARRGTVAAGRTGRSDTPTGRRAAPTGADDDMTEFEAPLTPADYADREGYQADFVGAAIPLPTAVAAASDLLTFDDDGQQAHVLHYEHFSVVMSRSRRLCLFSAANLDGSQTRKMKRRGWRTDPRIAEDKQIRSECYGNPPRFSRGHMTRREDPVWGPEAVASRANGDSMHVTNAVPQLQPFNAGIWLGLEDYALDHAREDDMRISVFTGPCLRPDDPHRFGVQVPRTFWKVIAFIHDQTGALCATGYTMSQANLIGDEEFVFGPHQTFQRSLVSIERLTGLSFGLLVGADPFEEQEAVEPPPLTDFSQITLLRR